MPCALLTALLLSACMVPAFAGGEPEESQAQNTDTPRRVFELRTYYTNEGKLNDLHKRFRDHTCRLLKQHGAELIGFWTPLDEKDGKSSKLIYLVAFPSREAARKTWEEFGKDPAWRKVYEESHKNGALVGKVDSVFMEPTDYSEMK
jgi:NIPSNAP